MGGYNIEANAILYYVLNLGIELAGVLQDSATKELYTTAAATLKEAANELLWREDMGFYVDNETTTMAPQDGNSFAGEFEPPLKQSFLDSLIVLIPRVLM